MRLIQVGLVLACVAFGAALLFTEDPVLAEVQAPRLVPARVPRQVVAAAAVPVPAPQEVPSEGVLPAAEAQGRFQEEEEPVIPIARAPGFYANRGAVLNPEAVYLLLAKMCLSEEGWQPRGCPAIWQVVENVRERNCRRAIECVDGAETHLSAMQRLSPRVSGRREVMTSRTAWISNLTDSEDMPTNWVECAPGQTEDCSGTWDRYKANWTRIRALARRIVTQRNIEQCAAPVITWGGSMDDGHMSRRNVRRLDAGEEPLLRVACEGTANRFYAPASSVTEALRLPTPGVDLLAAAE